MLNGALARILQTYDIDAVAETSQEGSAKQIDIAVQLDSLVIALEGERGNQNGAIRDAQKRLDEARDDR